MAITLTSTAMPAQPSGVASTASITVAADTKLLLFFIAIDNSNSAANNTAPSVVSWNGVNATYVSNIVTDTTNFGQCQWLYKIENPTPATGTATVTHATQYHHQIVVNVVNTNPLTVTYSDGTVRGGGTSPSISMPSSVGDITLFSIAADALDPASVVANNGSTQLAVTGGASRQTYRVSQKNSSGSSNSENWTLATSQRYSSLAVNIVDGAFIVDTINGSSSNPAIDVSSSNTANTTGLGTITSLTISDGTRSLSGIPSMPSGDGTFTLTWPYADGVIAPLFGSVTATFGDGTHSAAIVGNTPVPSGFASVTFAGATDVSQYHLGHILTLTDGKRMYYPTTNGAVINPDGSLAFTTLPYTLNAMLHNVHSGGDGTITSVTVVITESGAVAVAGGGLTSSGLTSSGLTASGLTSTGL